MKDKKNTNAKKKKQLHLPAITPLFFIILIGLLVLVGLITGITVNYVDTYNKNKVGKPFASDLASVDNAEIIYGNKNTITDLNFVLYSTDYNNTTGVVKFQTFAYENENTRSLINASEQISVRLGMYSDWIKVEQTTTAYKRKIAAGPKVALGNTSQYRADYSISNIPTLPKHVKLFVDIKTIPVYAHVTYKTSINGTEKTKHYVLKYEAKDYIIGATTIEEKREKEYQVNASNIQWRYQNDTSWSTIMNTSSLIGIEARYSEGFIQWKRYTDTVWSNLKTQNVDGDITKLNGYVEGSVPDVKVESGYIYYKFPEQSGWTALLSTSTLQSIDVSVKDGYIVWRRWNQEEYTKLKAVTELPDYTEDKVVEARLSASKIQWRYAASSSTSYTDLENATVDTLIGVQIRIHDSKLQWKCKDETEWKDVILNGNPVTESSIDTTPAKYGPTTGDFKK